MVHWQIPPHQTGRSANQSYPNLAATMHIIPSRPATAAYWMATGLLSLGLITSGFAQVFHTKFMVDGLRHLGYPTYILYLLGSWKILGATALLLPEYPLVKEWAYAGLFFLLTGALVSHVASGDNLLQIMSPLLFTLLVLVSWRLRPPHRRLPVLSGGR